MARPFGFAVVGCGMIARFHARAVAAIPGARVAALVSRTPGAKAAYRPDRLNPAQSTTTSPAQRYPTPIPRVASGRSWACGMRHPTAPRPVSVTLPCA